jgi:hypothetical protein
MRQGGQEGAAVASESPAGPGGGIELVAMAKSTPGVLAGPSTGQGSGEMGEGGDHALMVDGKRVEGEGVQAEAARRAAAEGEGAPAEALEGLRRVRDRKAAGERSEQGRPWRVEPARLVIATREIIEGPERRPDADAAEIAEAGVRNPYFEWRD